MSTPHDNSEGPRPTVFVERQTYRMRRTMDAARLVPLLGLLLFAVPLLWPTDPENALSTSKTILSVFGVWLMLILVTIRLSWVLRSLPPSDKAPDRGGER